MYEKEKKELYDIVNLKDCEDCIYKKLKEKVESWENQTKVRRVFQSLKRDYEIGVPIDRVNEESALYVSIFSILISGLVFAFGDGYKEGYIAVVIIGIILVILVAALVGFTMLSYQRKRKLKTVIDFLKEVINS